MDTNKFDVAIVGAGILGVCTAYWIAKIYDSKTILIDKEDKVAAHASSRNTGVVHRPFYLNPEKKKIFAESAQKSYFLWMELASKFSLPWQQVGTLEVATSEEGLKNLEQYKNWSSLNGMEENETEILDRSGVQKVEPQVNALGAILSKTDTSVDFGDFARIVFEIARKNGVAFLHGYVVDDLKPAEIGITLELSRKLDRSVKKKISCRFLINLTGGGSIDIAHKLGLAKDLTDLHFRGEYWTVEPSFGRTISRHVYSVPRFKEFPFLDPHFIVRADGRREIGPNAVLVFGPNAYEGLSEYKSQIVGKIFERPIVPKFKLFVNGAFLSLVWHESRSSLSKDVMCQRVRDFIPRLDSRLLFQRGVAGVRNSVINSKGFVPEAIEIYDRSSLHVLNYNSPGATGAPAYAAHLIVELQNKGYLDGVRKNATKNESDPWQFESLVQA